MNVDFYETVLDVINMRSFSSLWYWIVLAVLWSSASHFVLGVPYDVISRAYRSPERMRDVEDLVRINGNRIFGLSEAAALVLVAVISTALTILAVAGFGFGIEFLQALFLLLFPMVFVILMSIRTARIIRTRSLAGEGLIRALRRLRFAIQLWGMLWIIITAGWGMYYNLSHLSKALGISG